MLATLDDLVALGGIPGNTTDLNPLGIRATRLLELASAQVVSYVGASNADITSEATLLAAVTANDAVSLAAIVAECAAARLNVTAAPSTDPYAFSGQPMSVMLNRWHKAQIDELFNFPSQGSKSIINARDEDSSLLILTGLDAEYVPGPSVFDGGTWYPV